MYKAAKATIKQTDFELFLKYFLVWIHLFKNLHLRCLEFNLILQEILRRVVGIKKNKSQEEIEIFTLTAQIEVTYLDKLLFN